MKKIILLILVVVLLPIILWSYRYYSNLRPDLIVVLDLNECSKFDFDRRGLAKGKEVILLLEARNIVTDGSDHYFAIKGKNQPRFEPDQFHGVHGSLEFELADKDKVYFYSYDSRYEPIIFAP